MSFFDISGLERKVMAILAMHEGLSMHGFAVVGEGILPIFDIAQQREIEREALLSLDSLRAIAFAEGWIESRLQHDNERINRRHTSMALKHLAESETGYLANGQFIVAALLQRFALLRNGSDVFFNVAEDSVQRAVRNQRLSAYLGEMKMNKRVIKQVAPATGWIDIRRMHNHVHQTD